MEILQLLFLHLQKAIPLSLIRAGFNDDKYYVDVSFEQTCQVSSFPTLE